MSEPLRIESKRVRVFIVEESSMQVEVEGDFDLDSNKGPSFKIKQIAMEIGIGEYHKQVNGNIELDLHLVGNYRADLNNVNGMVRIQGVIDTHLRKD